MLRSIVLKKCRVEAEFICCIEEESTSESSYRGLFMVYFKGIICSDMVNAVAKA